MMNKGRNGGQEKKVSMMSLTYRPIGQKKMFQSLHQCDSIRMNSFDKDLLNKPNPLGIQLYFRTIAYRNHGYHILKKMQNEMKTSEKWRKKTKKYPNKKKKTKKCQNVNSPELDKNERQMTKRQVNVCMLTFSYSVFISKKSLHDFFFFF